MRRSFSVYFTLALVLLLAGTTGVFAQALTAPPGGGNQRAVVTQYMGMVSVTIDYNSPDVTSPAGDDRTGQIWGQLGFAQSNMCGKFGRAKLRPFKRRQYERRCNLNEQLIAAIHWWIFTLSHPPCREILSDVKSRGRL